VVYIDSADPPFSEAEYADLNHLIESENGKWKIKERICMEDPDKY